MLFLIGFMAAGKTSVGRALAERTSRRFVDLDDGLDTSLVAHDEPEFRRREAAALQDAIAAGDGIVATGGGCAAFGDNLARMRDAGLVVALGVDVATAKRRAGGGPSRPLLANADALHATRAPIYRRAHAVVDTAGHSIDEVVDRVRHVERAWRPGATVVALGERSYPITVSPELAVDIPPRSAVVTDSNVAKHWLPELGFDGPTVLVSPGEASKSVITYQRVCEELVGHGLDRGSTIIALGGGVVGDLAGFVAATLFRGVSVVQVPTTLVAMTDAAIGGKTALDLRAGKNLIGAFHQPALVSCALATLSTLPDRERRAGFGELWKYALLDGDAMWSAVDACAAWGGKGGAPPAALTDVIQRAIAYKAAIVGADERERSGQRALLNLGHTIGHAIESASGMLHGEAVGLGLLAACRVSRSLGGPDLEPAMRDALTRTGLTTELDRWLTDDVIARVGVDKKRSGGTIRYIAVRGVGACEPVDIAVTELGRILRSVSSP